MEFVTHNEKRIDPNGTFLQGYLSITYDDLVELFGEPETGDGYKVDAEWILQFTDREIATIYNYKNGPNYNFGQGDVTKITDWHIGGSCKLMVKRVGQITKKSTSVYDS